MKKKVSKTAREKNQILQKIHFEWKSRTSLKIKMDGPIDQCNLELRAIMRKIWKRTPEKILDSLVPPPGDGKISHTKN